jgi:hypothetical protein
VKKTILFLFAATLAITSCKKKDKDPEPTNTGGGGGGSTTGGSGNNGSGPASYNAIFEMIKPNVKFMGAYLSAFTNAQAFLSNQLVVNEMPGGYMNMGQVMLNNVVLANHSGSSNYFYNDTASSNFMAPYTWSVSGSPNFTTTVFTHTTTFPSFPNYAAAIPDSVSKAAGFNISLSGTSDCDFVEAFVIGPGGTFVFPKYVAGNATKITFTGNELSAVNTGTGYISLKFANDNVQTLNGKQVNIRSSTSFVHTSFKIKP